MTIIKSLILVSILSGMVGSLTSASAASFDCANAVTSREKQICADKELSDLDSQLGRLYQERRALLSPGGAEILLRSQRAWLRFVTTICPAGQQSDIYPWPISYSCLDREYRDRLQQLRDVGNRIGPFVFNRLDQFTAKKRTSDPEDRSGSRPGFSYRIVSYPQIDSPTSPIINAWNKQVLEKFPANESVDGDSEIDIIYTIGYANDRLISVGWGENFYGHGAAHGYSRVTVENWVLAPSFHRLQSNEVFYTGGDWEQRLLSLVLDALKKAKWQPSDQRSKEEVMRIIVDPDRWLFTAEGLQVAFGSYEGGCYACSPPPAIVSWAELKPLLSPHAVVP